MADAHIKGPEMAKAAAAAKLFATDTAMHVATECVQLHGAHGISNDGGINRYMRDAKLLQVVEGVG
jgi:alkylation response protein AidB-like acyl-CoA dehydrogenase